MVSSISIPGNSAECLHMPSQIPLLFLLQGTMSFEFNRISCLRLQDLILIRRLAVSPRFDISAY